MFRLRFPLIFLAFAFTFLPLLHVDAAVGMQKLGGNFVNPVDIVHAKDGTKRLFIVLQEGKIVIWNGTRVLATPFLNINDTVSCCGERGLLSLVFHPGYKSNGFFYVLYTNKIGDVVVARYKVSTNANRALKTSRLILLKIPHPTHSNHNGGKLLFGKDGNLYISVGDGGSGGANAQDLGSLLGKILRINVNSGNLYSIPPSNPFVNVAGARKEIWALGLRNPWRFSFDRLNGNLYVADVGQNRFEEVNLVGAKATPGMNFGWPRLEGRQCYFPATGCRDSSYKMPFLVYSHTDSTCSVTGGYVYRGRKIPALYGTYLYADFCSGVIRGAKRIDGKWTISTIMATGKRISTFGEDAAGELYFAHRADPDGAIYRIIKN